MLAEKRVTLDSASGPTSAAARWVLLVLFGSALLFAYAWWAERQSHCAESRAGEPSFLCNGFGASRAELPAQYAILLKIRGLLRLNERIHSELSRPPFSGLTGDGRPARLLAAYSIGRHKLADVDVVHMKLQIDRLVSNNERIVALADQYSATSPVDSSTAAFEEARINLVAHSTQFAAAWAEVSASTDGAPSDSFDVTPFPATFSQAVESDIRLNELRAGGVRGANGGW